MRHASRQRAIPSRRVSPHPASSPPPAGSRRIQFPRAPPQTSTPHSNPPLHYPSSSPAPAPTHARHRANAPYVRNPYSTNRRNESPPPHLHPSHPLAESLVHR